jgi:hypothetical protein
MVYSKLKDIAVIVLQAARVAFDLANDDLWELVAFFAFVVAFVIVVIVVIVAVVVGGPNVLDAYKFHRLALHHGAGAAEVALFQETGGHSGL